MGNINWIIIRAKLKEAVLVLPHFLKNPVQGMRMLPDWDWPTILILQGIFAAGCSTLANLLERDIVGMIVGLITVPIASILVVAIASGFFFYTFMFYFKREVPFRQIFVHVLFASIPTQIVMIVASLIPPIVLVGIAASLLLLYVSFVDSFHMDRKKVRNMLLAIMIIYSLFWASQLLQRSHRREGMRIKATPESLEILEKEMGVD